MLKKLKMEMNIPSIGLPRIVIIGGGFAGLKLGKQINSDFYQVVLIDKNNYHTFQPLMYQVASSGLEPESIVYPIRKVFKGQKNFHFRIGEVTEINTSNNYIKTDIGKLGYDKLIIATGATTNYFGNKSIQKHSLTMKSLLESLELRNVILQNFEKAISSNSVKEREGLMNFVIVGAGATGVELAGALVELKRNVFPVDYPDLDIRQMQIHLIEASDKVLPLMSLNASSKSEKFLKELGVNLWLNTTVVKYDGTTVQTFDKEFNTRTLIWTAGVKGNPVDGNAWKLTKNARIVVDEFNRVKNFETVFAVGDVACIESELNGKGHPMLASVAGQQGEHLGNNLNRLAKNKLMIPFKYRDRGTMATVGRNKAVVDLKRFQFGGIIAWFIWMFLHLMLLVEFRNRIIVLANWIWSYIRYDNSLRLIIRPDRRSDDKE